MNAPDNPLHCDAFMRLMAPRDWARDASNAVKAGWPLPLGVIELTHRVSGRDDEAERIAADLAYNRLKNSGDLMRRESQRALELQIQQEDEQ